jgi:ATP-dependent Lhr-like helicase
MSLISKDNLHWAHPIIHQWFAENLGEPTEPQIRGWKAILSGKSTLISAPTGSGKTFAAFLTCIDKLFRDSISGNLADQTEVVYISPLKALSNDIHTNLTVPLQNIMRMAKENNLPVSEIRVAVRTGDTLAKERQAMLKKPPHILITTPESFYILLTAEKSRAMLKNVKTVIIDEIHVMVNDKRGSHLSLSLERLEALTQKPFMRIGLSATQKPIELVAQFLMGVGRPKPKIINIGYTRKLDLKIEVPGSELGSVASNEMWDEIYDRVAKLTEAHRSTLIFVNTRRMAERVAHHLSERLGEDLVYAHHGSLSRKLRLTAEKKLKNGELKALVATASLELGIDIGDIDLVCQIGSPRAIAVALQRVGRSGHWHQAVSKGIFFATTLDELVECAALLYAIKNEDLDKLIIPDAPIDILSQQIVATCATGEWREQDLFKLVTKSFPYAKLSLEVFNTVINMLSNGIAGSRGRYSAYLHRDQVNGVINARRGARLTAIMSGGAIPDNSLFTVIAEPTGSMVGTLDEDFAVESNRGDIILLGTTSWMIKRIESATGRVLVEDAHGAPPSVPFWRGEAPARTDELSWYVSEIREKIHSILEDVHQAKEWLRENCGMSDAASEQLIAYLHEGKKILGAIPTQKLIIAERFFDESGGMQLIIHAPFGARINKAWGLALRKRFCHSFNFELQAAATDNGINISLSEQHSFPLADVFHFLNSKTVKETLLQSVLQSPLFPTRWRWVAVRSLALVKFRGGKKIPPNIIRMLSDDLLAAVFPDAAACQDNLGGKIIEPPDHPLINETLKDVLTEALDLEGLIKVLDNMLDGNIQCLAVDTPVPSVFSHELLNANPYAFLDDTPLEERRARAVDMRRVLPDSVLQEVGRLDPAVIKDVQAQIWPDIRSADEMHDFLQTVIALPLSDQTFLWENHTKELLAGGRAGIAVYQDQEFFVATEKVKTFLAIYPDAEIQNDLKEIEQAVPSQEEAILELIRGWIFHLGPTTQDELVCKLHLSVSDIYQALIKLETSGLILRGHFRFYDVNQIEWCERRILARIHRETVGKLRKEISPVSRIQFMHWLLIWQHLLPGNQLRGEHGLLEVIKELQGFEIPANAWEKHILAKRVTDYSSDLLDNLCLKGIIGWGRLSSPLDTKTKKRIIPTSVSPIAFFVRAESDWLTPVVFDEDDLSNLRDIAKEIYVYLKKYGASFFIDIVKGVNHLKSEVENGLWELVTAGLITADGFDNLRSLIDPRRRLGKGRRRIKSYSTGRWAVLHLHETSDHIKHIEAICWMLLKRYGIVFRDLIGREKNLPTWREILMTLRRLEDRGEIRSGRFVDGFLGEQFALPYAAESLRGIKKKELPERDIVISAVDPLNLVGIILPGEKVTATSGKDVSIQFTY